jgi:hypothetical protein
MSDMVSRQTLINLEVSLALANEKIAALEAELAEACKNLAFADNLYAGAVDVIAELEAQLAPPPTDDIRELLDFYVDEVGDVWPNARLVIERVRLWLEAVAGEDAS